MVAAAAQSVITNESSRRFGRMDLSVPIEILPLSHPSTKPIPARALNVSEGGLSTIVAGEFSPFELVSLEFRLPDVGMPLRTRAWVRYQSELRCGLEFAGLSHQQRSMIRYWLQRAGGLTDVNEDAALKVLAQEPSSRPNTKSFWRVFALLGIMIVILFATLVGWYWQNEWTEMERNLSFSQTSKSGSTPVPVPESVMEKLLVHRVDPQYPEAAREANLSGIVTLNVVVEEDGTVSQLTALSGAKELQQAALDAVRWWRFQPYVMDGHPVRVQTSLAVEFRP